MYKDMCFYSGCLAPSTHWSTPFAELTVVRVWRVAVFGIEEPFQSTFGFEAKIDTDSGGLVEAYFQGYFLVTTEISLL